MRRRAQIRHPFHHFQKLGALGAKGIHSTTANEIFQSALIHKAHAYTITKIHQAGKGSILGSGFNNFLHCRIAHALDAGQAKTNSLAAVDGELVAAFINIRRQNINFIIAADGDVPAQLIAVADNAVQEGRHKLGSPVSL